MKFHFQKDMKLRKPKRWYATIQGKIYYTSWMFPIDEVEALRQKIKNAGFGKNMHCHNEGRTKFMGYVKTSTFMYFQSPAEEARFMLWASGGVDV